VCDSVSHNLLLTKGLEVRGSGGPNLQSLTSDLFSSYSCAAVAG